MKENLKNSKTFLTWQHVTVMLTRTNSALPTDSLHHFIFKSVNVFFFLNSLSNFA